MTRPPHKTPGPEDRSGVPHSSNALLERLLANPSPGIRVTRLSSAPATPKLETFSEPPTAQASSTVTGTSVMSLPSAKGPPAERTLAPVPAGQHTASPAPPTSAPASRDLPHMPEEIAAKLDHFAASRADRQRPAAAALAQRLKDEQKRRPAQTSAPAPVRAGTRADLAPAIGPAPVQDLPLPPPLPLPPLDQPPPADSGPPTVPKAGESEIRKAIKASKRAFIGIGVLSFLINILMLTGPLFMLQVYDRVMTSGSMPTLIALSALTALLYAMTGFFEMVRTRIVSRAGVEIDQRLSDRIFRASLRRSLHKQGASVSALRDLDTVRQFASGPAPMTFFDAPWTPIYLLVIFLVHWALGIAATLGAALVIALTLMSERSARRPLEEANKSAMRSLELADSAQRNVEALASMGMIEAYRKRWQKASGEALAWQIHAADRLGSTSSVGKAVRLLLQSMMLAVGAGLAIHGDISAGSIIAGTIIFGRALAPVEQAVGQWKSFVKARESFGKLSQLLKEEPEPPARTALPPPKGHLLVSNLRVAAPDTRKLILANLNFQVRPGEVCAVIGPSASGKSTLARTLVGLWPPFSGTISIDGADLQQWSPEALGRYIGYLPQDVELFAGTVRDNICRFREDATDAEVIEAAHMAHAHEMILALPQGYDTQVGSFATYLSAGQRQRIGLARALFGNPALLVLDEPNANLDRLGDEALSSALAGMKKRGQAVVLVSHRVQAMSIADTLLYVDRGVQRAFGPQAEVMKLFRQGGPEAAKATAQGAKTPPAASEGQAKPAKPPARPAAPAATSTKPSARPSASDTEQRPKT